MTDKPTAQETLLPCPLCAGTNLKVAYGATWGSTFTSGEKTPPLQICDITCSGCGLRLWGDCHPVAHKWNRRDEITRLRAALEEIRDHLATNYTHECLDIARRALGMKPL